MVRLGLIASDLAEEWSFDEKEESSAVVQRELELLKEQEQWVRREALARVEQMVASKVTASSPPITPLNYGYSAEDETRFEAVSNAMANAITNRRTRSAQSVRRIAEREAAAQRAVDDEAREAVQRARTGESVRSENLPEWARRLVVEAEETRRALRAAADIVELDVAKRALQEVPDELTGLPEVAALEAAIKTAEERKAEIRNVDDRKQGENRKEDDSKSEERPADLTREPSALAKTVSRDYAGRRLEELKQAWEGLNASRLQLEQTARRTVCLPLKRVVGNAINAGVGAEADMARQAARRLTDALSQQHAAYAAWLVADRLVDRLLDPSFKHYEAALWGFAVFVLELAHVAPIAVDALRAKLAADYGPIVAGTATESANVKIAALTAAVAVVPYDSKVPHPMGGIDAAWTWLARFVNAAKDYGALPSLVTFLELAAFAMWQTFRPHFQTLISLIHDNLIASLPPDATPEAAGATSRFRALFFVRSPQENAWRLNDALTPHSLLPNSLRVFQKQD